MRLRIDPPYSSIEIIAFLLACIFGVSAGYAFGQAVFP